jgi:hypothetical protein
MKTKIVYRLFFSPLKKREIARLPKTEEKNPSTKYKKKTAKRARMCMYDFIRPKMETYFFPAITSDQKFEFFLFRCFVILQFRARARFFIFASLSYRQKSAQKEKKTPKMFRGIQMI